MSPEEQRKRLDREQCAQTFWSIATLAGLINRVTAAVSRELAQPLDPYTKPREIEGQSAEPENSRGVPDEDQGPHASH